MHLCRNVVRRTLTVLTKREGIGRSVPTLQPSVARYGSIDHDAAHAASDVIASVVSDAVANLISEPPQEITGQCNIWKNYVDFPVGKL